MKKFIVSILIGFLILVFGAASYAMEFKASGFIEASGHWGTNFFNNPYEMSGLLYGGTIATISPATNGTVPLVNAIDKTRAWMEERARLRFDAIADKNLSGTIYMELDSTRWGEASGGRNKAGAWMGDEPGFEIKNAYITFGLPAAIPIPVTMQVGIQPLPVRELVYNDGPGISAGIKLDPASIKLGWYKSVENLDFAADDDDIYYADVSTKFQALNVGVFGLYYNMNTYGMVGQTSAVRNYAADMMWFGLYAGGKLGPVNLNFDFMYDNGTVEGHGAYAAYKDVDYSGWAILAKVDYPWEKFSFGLWGLYGAGADANKTAADGLPNAAGLDEMKGFVVPPRNETGGDWSLIFFGTGGAGFNRAITGYVGAPGVTGYVSRGSPGGTWAIGPRITYQVTPNYLAEFRGLYIGDTVKNGNVVASPMEAGGLRDDDYIGMEVNLLNYFKIYKNLLLNVGLAYMFAGDGMDYYDTATASNKSPDDPYLIMTRLIYLF